MSRNKKSTRSWWRELFIDHPGTANKDPEAFVASGTGATKTSKLYCKACWLVDTDRISKDDIDAVNRGRITTPRSEAAIEQYGELIN